MSEKQFQGYFHRYRKGSVPFSVPGRYLEPIEAIEAAEAHLQEHGAPNVSHVEIRFNGDPKPHYLLFHLGPGRTGIFNTDACLWPVFNIQGMDSARDQLHEIPWEVPNEGSSDRKQDSEEAEKRKTDEDAPTLDLGAERDEGDEEGDEDADSPEHEDSEEPEGENGGEDEDEDSPEPGRDEDGDDGGEEDEPMRLKFFSKMRGPKGWRKRADSDPERERNAFTWWIGTVDEDDDRENKPPLVRAHFMERDDQRTKAKLTVNFPENSTVVELDGRIEITIPTQG